jgi:hypothetical protein
MKRLVSLTLVASLASCGLISSDITDFPLRLPRKEFAIDTSMWNLQVSGSFPSVACPPADCAMAASTFCGGGACTADCGGGGTCTAHVPMSMFQRFDLANEAEELRTIDQQAVISVTVDAVAFEIEENTMNVGTPSLNVFIAPEGVTDAGDPLAEQIGTILPIAAGFVGSGQVDITTTGELTLERYMSDFRTPFVIIVTGVADIEAGQPVPSGMLQGVVTVIAHAGL